MLITNLNNRGFWNLYNRKIKIFWDEWFRYNENPNSSVYILLKKKKRIPPTLKRFEFNVTLNAAGKSMRTRRSRWKAVPAHVPQARGIVVDAFFRRPLRRRRAIRPIRYSMGRRRQSMNRFSPRRGIDVAATWHAMRLNNSLFEREETELRNYSWKLRRWIIPACSPKDTVRQNFAGRLLILEPLGNCNYCSREGIRFI